MTAAAFWPCEDDRPAYGTDRCEECDQYIVFGADGWGLWDAPASTGCYQDADAAEIADVVANDGDVGCRHAPKPFTAGELLADHTGDTDWLVAS